MACHYVYYHPNRPRDYKNQYQDHQDHLGDSLLAPPRVASRLKVRDFSSLHHNSEKLAWNWTRLGGNCSQECPAGVLTAQRQNKMQNTGKTKLIFEIFKKISQQRTLTEGGFLLSCSYLCLCQVEFMVTFYKPFRKSSALCGVSFKCLM